MPASEQVADLERLAASQVAACLDGLPVGAPLPLDSSSDLCFILELLIPALLGSEHPEWRGESIDGFYLASATKSDREAARLAGTCILITDQTVTPFLLDLRPAGAGAFQSLRIRLGEPGHGRLGISGPKSTSTVAQGLLLTLSTRLDQVKWAYDVDVGSAAEQ